MKTKQVAIHELTNKLLEDIIDIRKQSSPLSKKQSKKEVIHELVSKLHKKECK